MKDPCVPVLQRKKPENARVHACVSRHYYEELVHAIMGTGKSKLPRVGKLEMCRSGWHQKAQVVVDAAVLGQNFFLSEKPPFWLLRSPTDQKRPNSHFQESFPLRRFNSW